jgi:hypothetical protein
VAGTAQIHRAVLRMLEAPTFEAFLADLGGEVQAILRVDSLRLVLEAEGVEAEEPDRIDGVLVLRPRAFPTPTCARAARGRRGTWRCGRWARPSIHGEGCAPRPACGSTWARRRVSWPGLARRTALLAPSTAPTPGLPGRRDGAGAAPLLG